MNRMIKHNWIVCLAAAGMLVFHACSKDDDGPSVQKTALKIAVTAPEDLQNAVLKEATVTFKEINSANTTTSTGFENGSLNVDLPEGSYDVSLEGTLEYTDNGQTVTSKVRGYKEGVVLSGTATDLALPLYVYSETPSFVFKEIFFTGTVTPEGKTYNGDKYFIIYNNSDAVQYADGLAIAESDFLTTTKRDYMPNVMNEAFTSKTIVVIPGSGTEHAVAPGQSLIVANNAINHLEYNSNSLDLTKADFELELLPTINVDNPEVPNLINVSSFLTMHNRGFKSYVMFKLTGTVDQFKTQQQYSYDYVNAAGNITSTDSYKIPNKQIIDAVNLSVGTEFAWIVTAPSLDMGWTYCGKIDGDENRYGKSVQRKVLSVTGDGREILKDTNNSTEDFNPEMAISLK